MAAYCLHLLNNFFLNQTCWLSKLGVVVFTKPNMNYWFKRWRQTLWTSIHCKLKRHQTQNVLGFWGLWFLSTYCSDAVPVRGTGGGLRRVVLQRLPGLQQIIQWQHWWCTRVCSKVSNKLNIVFLSKTSSVPRNTHAAIKSLSSRLMPFFHRLCLCAQENIWCFFRSDYLDKGCPFTLVSGFSDSAQNSSDTPMITASKLRAFPLDAHDILCHEI